MKNTTITVLTPTYNRAKLIPRLFESLIGQTVYDFEWLIVDDGSKDNTKEIVTSFNDVANFHIKYLYKENGGKHTALNFAYPSITTPLTFIVDSDDWLTADAIAIIDETYAKYNNENDLCGFSFLRGTPRGGYLSSSGVPKNAMKESYVDCRINQNISGDMAEVWYTECLKRYPFPQFEGEKFLGEDFVWIKMSEHYLMRFFNNVIYISDYLEDGLTQNRRIHNIKSPNGCIQRASVFLSSDVLFRYKVKAMLQYIIYSRFARKKMADMFSGENYKLLFVLLLPMANLIYLKWERSTK